MIRISAAANTQSDVGDYPVDVAVLDPNYLGSPEVSGNLNVTPRPLDIALRLIERVYGQANPTSYNPFRITGFVNDILPFDSLDEVLEITAPAPDADFGTYPLTATLLTDNYNLQSFNAQMDIARRPITLRLPDSVRRIYGEPNPEIPVPTVVNPISAPNQGVASFDTIEDVFSYNNLPGITAPAGFYTLGSEFDNNYDVSLIENDSRIFVDPRPIRVAIVPSFERVYAEADPDPTDLVTGSPSLDLDPASGLASFDMIEDVLTVGGPGIEADVGSYPVYNGVRSPNYQITFASGRDSTVTVTPRPLRIFTNSFTRFFGDENPGVGIVDLSAASEGEGIAFFDTKSDVLTRNPLPGIEADVGEFALTKSTNNPNYSYDLFEAGTGTIAPRPLTVNLPTFTRIYGEENPSVAPRSISGTLPEFHTLSDAIRFIETPVTTTPAGAYPAVSFENPNYAFTYNGALDYTIEKRIMYLRVQNELRNYGSVQRPLRSEQLFGMTSDFNLTSFDDFDEVVRFNRPAQDANVGRYDISIQEHPNYTFTLSGINEGVAPYEQILVRPVTVRFFGETRLYGSPNARANADYVEITNLAPVDTRDAILTPASIPGTRSDVGTYSLGTSTGNANYVYDIAGNANIVVEQRTLSFEHIYRTYGDSALIFSALGGNGPASFDAMNSLIRPELIGGSKATNRTLSAGYYPVANYGLTDTTNYRIKPDPSGIFTVLPREVTIEIADFSLTLDSTQDFIDTLGQGMPPSSSAKPPPRIWLTATRLTTPFRSFATRWLT